jgi:Ni2+-binding GTPase involved in maturation of urease and hydrogenase
MSPAAMRWIPSRRATCAAPRAWCWSVPNVLMVNKLDLVDQWEIKPSTLADLRRTWSLAETSAASGDGVEQAFHHLAEQVFA